MIFVLLMLLCSAAWAAPEQGDLIFQDSPSSHAALIAGVTQSRMTHCGIIVMRNGHAEVLEAAQTVRYTPLQIWIDRGHQRAYALYRLKFKQNVAGMVAGAQAFLGHTYDLRFVLGGEEVYCSELLYRAALDGCHIRLVEPQPLRELNWRPWEMQIRAIRDGALPLDEVLVSPVALTRSSWLVCVYDSLTGTDH